MALCAESQCMPQTGLTEALTTELEVGRREQARENGATRWLTKPVGGTKLIRLIEQVLARRR